MLVQYGGKKHLNSIIQRLAFTVYIYCIWGERSSRIFRNNMLPSHLIQEQIILLIRYRLLSLPRAT